MDGVDMVFMTDAVVTWSSTPLSALWTISNQMMDWMLYKPSFNKSILVSMVRFVLPYKKYGPILSIRFSITSFVTVVVLPIVVVVVSLQYESIIRNESTVICIVDGTTASLIVHTGGRNDVRMSARILK